MKKLFFALMVVLFATSAVAQTGLTCEDPIPVNKNYSGTISEPGEYWFTAWSYDLPLNVHFTPESDNSKLSPEIYVDFTCEPGVYDDYKLDSVINGITSFGIELPIELMCTPLHSGNKVEWDLSIGANYRDNLTECGITYNVQAFVKVYFPEAGTIRFQPDTTFTSCMETADYVTLGNTFDVIANDSDRVFVLPYSEWKKDSVQFAWEGNEPAKVWVASMECDFYPSSGGFVWTSYNVTKDKPFVLSNEAINDAVKKQDGGGVFFAKVLSEGSGKLTIQKSPLSPIQGGATLLEYGKSVTINANDSNQLFCFPRTWNATEFVASTNYVVTMYAANNIEFAPSADDDKVLANYSFIMADNDRKLQLSNTDISQLLSNAIDDYIYVRFMCNKNTTLTPIVWQPSSCASQSLLLCSGREISVPRSSSDVLYRLRYEDWNGYDINVKWTNRSKQVPVYFSSVCDFNTSSSDPNVFYYKSFKMGTTVIPVDNVNEWVANVDEDGFLYVRMNPQAAGKATFTSTKPVEEDPKISPCVENSIELKAGNQLTLNLDSAFTVYRINYAEWVAQNVTFRWSGETDLHTFIAETCQFAVAPYNKYVVDYIAIPANEEFVLDVATLSAFAGKVDEDGYLYIRFLTEKEGTLSVTNN